jgi:homoserine trans-succinylase
MSLQPGYQNEKQLRAVYGDGAEEYKRNRMKEAYMRDIKQRGLRS